MLFVLLGIFSVSKTYTTNLFPYFKPTKKAPMVQFLTFTSAKEKLQYPRSLPSRQNFERKLYCPPCQPSFESGVCFTRFQRRFNHKRRANFLLSRWGLFLSNARIRYDFTERVEEPPSPRALIIARKAQSTNPRIYDCCYSNPPSEKKSRGFRLGGNPLSGWVGWRRNARALTAALLRPWRPDVDDARIRPGTPDRSIAKAGQN